MENRFGVKDFFLFLLMAGLIVSVWMAVQQADHQWTLLQELRSSVDAQTQAMRRIEDRLAEGVRTVGNGATTTPADRASDPFARIRAATTLPAYAKGDWLVDAFGNNVPKLTPLLSSDAYAATVQGVVQESLGTRDPDTLQWKPFLAREWAIVDHIKEYDAYVEKQKAAGKSEEDIQKDPNVPNALQIVFKMRPGTRFADGTPLTADDVVFTYKFTMDPKINAPRDKAYLSRIVSVEKTAADEVTFTYREPYFEAFELAAGLGILPKHFYEQFPPEKFNDSVGFLMGSGPYRLPDPKTWKPGTLIQLIRNEQYWGVKPAFDKLVWQEITNDVAHLTAFRNGDIDFFAAQPEQYREMIGDAALLARTQHYEYQNAVGGYRYVAWNQKRNGKPTFFADKRVRQAMTMLVDRDRMMQEIMLGYAVPASGPFNPQSQQNDPNVKPWPFDIAKAKQLLKEAGFEDRDGAGVLKDKDGRPFEFALTYPSGSGNYDKMALFLKDAYARAGIVLRPDPLDWSILIDKLSKKDFEAISLGWTAGIETDIYQMFHSSQMVADGDDFMSYKNEELDKTIDQARRTIDEAKRMPLWRKAHAILHEDQPYTFLFFPKSLVFLDKRIENVHITKLGLSPREEWFVPVGRQRWTK